MEAVSDPMPIIQGILQTCQDLRPLRDEVYCQLIKQTNHVPQPNSTANRAHWHLLTCMSCTFLPSRGILRYLRFHLKRYGCYSTFILLNNRFSLSFFIKFSVLTYIWGILVHCEKKIEKMVGKISWLKPLYLSQNNQIHCIRSKVQQWLSPSWLCLGWSYADR